MTDARHDEPDDLAGLAGLYAVDALEPADRARFENYLVDHPEALDEVTGFQEAAAALSATVAADPGPSVRAAVLDEIGRTRQDAPVIALRADRPGRTRTRWMVAVAAALVVLAAVGGYALGSGDTATQSTELADVIRASDSQVVELTGPGGDLKVAFSAGQRRAVVVASDLAPVADDQTYEIWALQGTSAASAGRFTPSSDGSVEAVLDEADLKGVDLSDVEAFGVTVEPAGGSPAPTPPILSQGPV